MIVLSSMQAMREQRTALFAGLVLFFWHKLRKSSACSADCC
ncbi:MAG: hypothetical protein ACFB2W_06220 [Leptolyngbyaceae cyanobacterium]